MTGLLSAPIEVYMKTDLITILIEIYKLPETDIEKPKEYLCDNIRCPDVLCSSCPLGNPKYLNPDKEIFVTQIHKTLEVINYVKSD